MEDEKKVLFGTVVWFQAKRGFGFIFQGDNEPDIFVYWSDINQDSGFKTLQKDDKVSYEIGMNARNQPKAINVTVIK